MKSNKLGGGSELYALPTLTRCLSVSLQSFFNYLNFPIQDKLTLAIHSKASILHCHSDKSQNQFFIDPDFHQDDTVVKIAFY